MSYPLPLKIPFGTIKKKQFVGLSKYLFVYVTSNFLSSCFHHHEGTKINFISIFPEILSNLNIKLILFQMTKHQLLNSNINRSFLFEYLISKLTIPLHWNFLRTITKSVPPKLPLEVKWRRYISKEFRKTSRRGMFQG